MDAQLKAYSEKRIWSGYRIEIKPYKGVFTERRLTANEAAYLLGDLAYRSGQQETALEWLKRVDAKQSSVARAFSLRAVIEQHLGRSDLASHVMGFALQDGGDDPYVLTNATHLYWDKARATKSGTDPARDNVQRSVEFGNRALAADGSALEAGYFLALAYQQQEKGAQALSLLGDLYRQFPTDVRLNMELGRMLASTKDPIRAVPYLQRVIAWDHGDLRRLQAKQILERLGQAANPSASDFDQEHSAPIQLRSR